MTTSPPTPSSTSRSLPMILSLAVLVVALIGALVLSAGRDESSQANSGTTVGDVSQSARVEDDANGDPPAASRVSTPTTSLPTPTTSLPTPTTSLPGCPAGARSAVVDKAAQRWWLCADGRSITERLPMTSASAGYGLPPIGVHKVFARDDVAYGAHGEKLYRFVAFYTTPKGNRIAFHQYVNQDPATIGDLGQRGQSAGCLRLMPDDSQLVWDHLRIDDLVNVITN